MHGVADAWAWRAFSCFSLPAFVTVGCQQHPDPEFPTVAFPNPEEQGALKEAMLLAEERGAFVWLVGRFGMLYWRVLSRWPLFLQDMLCMCASC